MTSVVPRSAPGSYSASGVFTDVALSNTSQVLVGAVSVQAGAAGKIAVGVSGTFEWAGTETPNILSGKLQVKWRTAGVGAYTSLTEQTAGSDSNDDLLGEGDAQVATAFSYTSDLITGLTPGASYDIALWGRLGVDANDPYLFATGSIALSGT